ncbi:MAG: hypothetical protein JWM74_153 [Myxococcaceae bacterium]|nr:hypothetical protein [Myxococcaceae bacterium]
MAEGSFVIAGDTVAVFDPVGGASVDRATTVASEAFRKAIDEVRGDLRRALLAANAALNQAIHDDTTLPPTLRKTRSLRSWWSSARTGPLLPRHRSLETTSLNRWRRSAGVAGRLHLACDVDFAVVIGASQKS